MEIETFDNLVTPSFRQQESLSIGAQLHRILRAAIIRGELVPGQAISEIEMSKKFSISRQPVREAFIKLGEERLIEVLPQRGTYIRKISVKEVQEARHLREIIEVSIVREVTAKHDAGRDQRHVEITLPEPPRNAGDAVTFSYRIDYAKLRETRRREGRYLLRSNLVGRDPGDLWEFYLRLGEVEQAFRTLKGDLGIRPIFHSKETRIESHVFIAFIAYCLS